MPASIIIGLLKLTTSISIVGIIWMVILPRIAGTDEFSKYKNFLDERNINPEAMYYSDLNSMPDVLNRLEETR